MAGQQIPGPEGVATYSLLLIDSGTLARTATPTPGIQIHQALPDSSARDASSAVSPSTSKQQQAFSLVMQFLQDVEDTALHDAIRNVVTDNRIGFGIPEGNDNADWDPDRDYITINNRMAENINNIGGKNAEQNRMILIVDLAATIAHELEHRRLGKSAYYKSGIKRINREVQSKDWNRYNVGLNASRVLSFGFYSTLGPWCIVPGLIYTAGTYLTSWAVGTIDQGERSAWQVGLQKRLDWARHEYRCLLELMRTGNALPEKKSLIANRLMVICKSFNDIKGGPTEIRDQIGDLQMQDAAGNKITETSAQGEIEVYLQFAKKWIDRESWIKKGGVPLSGTG